MVDIAFLLDSSSSMKREYQKQIQVVEYIVKHFDVAPGRSHVGVVLFGRYAKIEIPFEKQRTSSVFKGLLKNLPHIGGHGRLDEGLYAAQTLLLGLKIHLYR